MSFFIGKVKINGNVVLAPMAGVTNIAYRKMCKSFGAAMTTTEMISDKGIYYNDKKTKELAAIDENEHPVAIQIFGGDIDTLVHAAKWVQDNTSADIIDINMGCPVPKVIKNNAGSKYLQDPDRIYDTIKAIVDNVSIPVTVKIRIGWDKEHINVFEVVDKIIKAGASAITIHGRTRQDLYLGEVNYDIIKEVKTLHPDFPIIANGNITDSLIAKKVLDYTGCDAIMVGRGSYGDPQVFNRINRYLDDGTLLDLPSLDERIKTLKEYANDLVIFLGEYVACKQLRGQAPWFIKDIRNGAAIRNKLARISSLSELNEILDSIE